MARYRKYSKEFKLQAAKLVTEQGYSYDDAAKQIGATGKSIRNWVENTLPKSRCEVCVDKEA